MVDLWSAGRGFLEENDNPHLRLAKPVLYVRDESDRISFGYGRPIEGLTPVIDLNARKIIEIEDLGLIPVPEKKEVENSRTIKLAENHHEHHFKYNPPTKPIDITQKEGIPTF